MGELGTFATALAVAASLWGIVASLIGGIRRRDDFVRSAEGAVYASALAVSVASLALIAALVTGDFSLQYVADYTSQSLAIPYRVGAMWAGQGGSLLLWAWIASLLAAWIVRRNRVKGWGIASFAVTVFSFVTGLFAAMAWLLESPFAAAPAGVTDGQGLNPLLQDPFQIIHPLALYCGYVLFTVPFALAISALAAGPSNGPWVKVATRWTVFSWIALTAGIILGARWAYAELGWGGYWGWDPVENASLLPWLSGTVMLHAGFTHWKSGRLRPFGFAMAVVTFVLCLFGTFLTRTGVISSVHAFSESNLGPTMGAAILLVVVVSGALMVWRWPVLRSPNPRTDRGHGWVGQLALAILLLGMTAAVLWGTIYPLFARAINGQEISVTPGFFRVTVTPLAVLVLAVFAFSPFLPGQQVANRGREAAIRATVGLVTFLAVWAVTGGDNPGVALVIALSVLALMSVVRKAVPRVASAWSETGSGRFLAALRASGPYVGHVGLVVLLAAITLNTAFQQQGRVTLTFGQSGSAGGQNIRLVDVQVHQLPDRNSFVAQVEVLGPNGTATATLETKEEVFATTDQPHAQVGIVSRPTQDIYVVLESADLQKGVATLSVFTNPAVMWIWFGGLLLVLGGVLYALPRRRGAPAMAMERTPAAETELVEV